MVATPEGWAVTRDERDSPLWGTPEKADAVEVARRVAQANAPSRVVIHLADGGVDSELVIESRSPP